MLIIYMCYNELMLNLRHFLKGDTLIEVTIAIGIFTLVAISVVAVVNISTSGAQSALENTLTRESVDSQAEAIRFIQNAFYDDNKNNLGDTASMPDTKTKESLYRILWHTIRQLADDNRDKANDATINSLANFNANTCENIYDKGKSILIEQNAFIINTRKLNSYVAGDSTADFAKDVIVKVKNQPDLFIPAITYPQLTYASTDGSLISDNLRGSTLSSIEGLYVVGIRDDSTTNVVVDNGGKIEVGQESAYYDFYVRSCWYNSGSEIPTTVSTTIRLRDPEAIAYIEPIPITPENPDESEEITFDNVKWKTYNDKKYARFSGVPYCDNISDMQLTRDGAAYITKCEPIENQHVIFPDDTSIRLVGSTYNPVNLGAYYDEFSTNDPFSLQVDIDASNVASHPSSGDDGLTISLNVVDKPVAPDDLASQKIVVRGVKAVISTSNQYVAIEGTSERITVSDDNDKRFNLLLEYNRGIFKACITESGKQQQCITATKQIPANTYLKVDYNLVHDDHGCKKIAVINLSNIQMRRSSTGTITF